MEDGGAATLVQVGHVDLLIVAIDLVYLHTLLKLTIVATRVVVEPTPLVVGLKPACPPLVLPVLVILDSTPTAECLKSRVFI